VFGVGSSLTASNVTVTTSGTISTVDGFHAYGVYNGYAAGSSYASGGTATLTNVTVNTSGASSSGVVTGNSGSTTITDSSITTTGTGAYGVQSFSAGSSSLTRPEARRLDFRQAARDRASQPPGRRLRQAARRLMALKQIREPRSR
jgi:hypothetical protein